MTSVGKNGGGCNATLDVGRFINVSTFDGTVSPVRVVDIDPNGGRWVAFIPRDGDISGE